MESFHCKLLSAEEITSMKTVESKCFELVYNLRTDLFNCVSVVIQCQLQPSKS